MSTLCVHEHKYADSCWLNRPDQGLWDDRACLHTGQHWRRVCMHEPLSTCMHEPRCPCVHLCNHLCANNHCPLHDAGWLQQLAGPQATPRPPRSTWRPYPTASEPWALVACNHVILGPGRPHSLRTLGHDLRTHACVRARMRTCVVARTTRSTLPRAPLLQPAARQAPRVQDQTTPSDDDTHTGKASVTRRITRHRAHSDEIEGAHANVRAHTLRREHVHATARGEHVCACMRMRSVGRGPGVS